MVTIALGARCSANGESCRNGAISSAHAHTASARAYGVDTDDNLPNVSDAAVPRDGRDAVGQTNAHRE